MSKGVKNLDLADNNHDLFKRYPFMMKSKRVSSIKRSPIGRKSPKRSPVRDKRAKKSKSGSGHRKHSTRRAKLSARRVEKSPRRKSTKRR